jgi:hypothetical protein
MIELIDADFYLGDADYIGHPLNGRGSFISVSDETGHLAPKKEPKPGASIFDWLKEINPYQYVERDVLPAIHAVNDEGFRKFYVLDLAPGQSVSTSFSRLAPYHKKMIDVRSKNLIGTATVSDEVRMEHPERIFAVPPPGFRRLSEYVLEKPGRYDAQLKIVEPVFASRYDQKETALQRELGRLIYFLGTGERPNPGAKETRIDAASAPIEFKVTR